MLETIDFQQSDADKLFYHSLENTGFAVLNNTSINWSLIQDAYQQWLDFFNGDNKQDFLFDAATHAGYIPQKMSEAAKGYDAKDLKEFYHYYPWANCPDHLRAVSQQLYDALYQLSITLLNWINQHLPPHIQQGLRLPLADMISSNDKCLLRFIHYPPVPSTIEAGAIRAAAHEDINLITILPAANTEGLQVLGKDQQWHDAPATPGTIIINTGDMLDECTGSHLRATTHRVINPKQTNNQSRVSTPLFLHARDEVVLSARHTGQSYRQERFQEIGLVADNPILQAIQGDE